MPRVSQEHLDARRRQILDSARACFTAQGFHCTSMGDILEEAGLSAGAVYRYFPAKDDIIVAIAEEALTEMATAFTAPQDPDASLLDLLRGVLRTVDALAERNGLGELALQVWAEAARAPALRERLADRIHVARARIAERLREAHGDAVDAERAAAVLVALLPGYLHARVLVGDMDVDRYCDGLAEVAALLEPAGHGAAPRAAR